MDDNPSIVIVSCSNTKPLSLIKLITKEKQLDPDPKTGIIKCPWIIDTKYYKATVNIIGIDEMYKRTPEFNENVDAVIIHMDSNKESGLVDLNLWDDLIKECEPEIKLLISNYCTNDTKITKTNALRWCLKHEFELIELYPTVDNTHTDEEIIKEKFGVDRIIEALQTHMWPNLEMKQNDKIPSSKKIPKEVQENVEGTDQDGTDDFTELFSQFHMMKDSFQSMPANQRKKYAEDMVTAFWKAIGGEEEELLDI
ncbi:alpha- and gamma-adaptin-binding protein p34-like [Aethina tumida]|uniref:alpha- and gamma-adaptin-binding protein p34-like n=1 Tax=Aethina tumida TaxID=116153 RepID=UPI0021492A41|nr:alpha- and gamma-adaptin-binding protein p34-like [Aethina tumida]